MTRVPSNSHTRRLSRHLARRACPSQTPRQAPSESLSASPHTPAPYTHTQLPSFRLISPRVDALSYVGSLSLLSEEVQSFRPRSIALSFIGSSIGGGSELSPQIYRSLLHRLLYAEVRSFRTISIALYSIGSLSEEVRSFRTRSELSMKG